MSFTYQYSQPSEYHFSLDSILTPKIIAEKLKNLEISSENFRVLDLCCGCGVMGFELSFHLQQIKNFDFVEVQEVYKGHFLENLKRVNRSDLRTHFYLMNYEKLQAPEFFQKYDLILCNPPYFEKIQGKLSPSEFKNRCRFFIDSTFDQLIYSVLHSLKPSGEAYMLIRSLSDHKMNLIDRMSFMLKDKYSFEITSDVRGTDLVKIFSKE